MARHAQPREMAELKGAVSKNPQRYEKEVPVNKDPLPDAPEKLSDAAKVCWGELKRIALPGVLTASDGVLFEITANLLAEYRDDPKDFPVGKYTHLIGNLARLGMSPADRQKLGTPGKKNEEEFDDF